MKSISKIRRRSRAGESIKQIARDTPHSRNTVRKYLRGDGEPTRRQSQYAGTFKALSKEELVRLTGLYEYDQSRPKRERRSSRGLYRQLVLEGYTGSYDTVCRFLRRLREEREMAASSKGFVPLRFLPGDAMQFDWSEEEMIIGDKVMKVKAAQFKLAHSRKPFIQVYPNECQEMLLDAFNRALSFYQGVPRRVIIDNPKTMVLFVGKSKDRDLNPRFEALLNHYVLEVTACNPASGWEKGQIENQVGYGHREIFAPMLKFDTLEDANDWLALVCLEQEKRSHPEFRDRTIGEVFEEEKGSLHPVGKTFDGYVTKETRVRKTCMVQYDTNLYSVPSSHVGRSVTLRIYADRIRAVHGQGIIAEHKRSFGRNVSVFDPLHYLPLAVRKPGSVRDGAPFKDLPAALLAIKDHFLKQRGGDREFVDLLLKVQEHGMDVVQKACELALEAKTLRLSAIFSLIKRVLEPEEPEALEVDSYPGLSVRPEADCHRYETLYAGNARSKALCEEETDV